MKGQFTQQAHTTTICGSMVLHAADNDARCSGAHKIATVGQSMVILRIHETPKDGIAIASVLHKMALTASVSLSDALNEPCAIHSQRSLTLPLRYMFRNIYISAFNN
eukprot:GHVU01139267.1.p2 GENE.GHVU01139267.1~~GHVU01139267.1.p2  ORF type:complete len:107 (-),score=6.71 GHVU01139267.1:1107-1427(-)